METVYAVIDAAGNVVNAIVAEPAFIASGALNSAMTYIDVTTTTPRPGPGWTRVLGAFVAPVVPPLPGLGGL